MRHLEALFAAVMLLGTASCIKENRSGCPCNLHLDLSQVDKNYIHKMDLMLAELGGSTEWKAVDKSYFGDTLILQVNKSEFDFCAWGNLAGSIIDRRGRTISPTQPSDSLWSFYRPIQTHCEDVFVSVVPEREHIPVTIFVRGKTEGISHLEPVLEQVGAAFSFNGDAVGDLARTYPQLVASPEGGAAFYCYKALLFTQQSATKARLELNYTYDGRSRSAEYPLGEMLLEMGEDISLSNQNPIVIDLVLGSESIFITIQVSDWEKHGVIEVTY